MKPSPTAAFADLLEGRSGDASAEVKSLATLVAALAAEEVGSVDARFRARLRDELLAAATAVEEAEVERFAAAVDSPREPARELVAVAAALEPANRPIPTPAFRYGLRNRLVAEADRAPSTAGRAAAAVASMNERMRRSLRSIMATGMVAALLAGTGASFAAAHSALPVDELYPLKRFKEAAALAIRSGPAKGFLYLDDARIRLDEVRGMTRRAIRDPKPYVSTFDTMDEQTIHGQTLIFDGFKDSAVPREAVERVSRFARIQVADLSALLDRIPDGAQPRARDSLLVAARVANRAANILSGCPCPSNALEQPPVHEGSHDGVACSCSPATKPDRSGGGSTGGSDQGTPNNQPPPDDGTPPPSSTPLDQVPDVPGSTDDQVKQLIDDLLNGVAPSSLEPPVAVPDVSPTVPVTLPTGLPHVGL